MLPRPPRSAALLVLALVALVCACGPSQTPRITSFAWLVGRSEPAFDPQGAPDPVGWALLRLLNYGLVEEDSSRVVVPAAAEDVSISSDGLAYTFRLRTGLAFADGTPCGSRDFKAALEAGLPRNDCSMQAWSLGAVRGVEQVRPRQRYLPALGIETPDDRTVVLRLSRPDSLLLRKLALPGVSSPWRSTGVDSGRWTGAVGLGPYRAAYEDPGRRLVLARARTSKGHAPVGNAPDSIVARFVVGAPRALAMLRGGGADLLWPVPPGFSGLPLPLGFGLIERQAAPPRRLLLVMRPDRPPTSSLDARLALAHALNHRELVQALGRPRGDLPWLPGAPPFEFPRLDPDEVRALLRHGDLGRSLHVMMCYDADGAAAEVAPVMQGQWASQGLYIALRGLRGPKLGSELRAGGSHLLLVETQPLLEDLSAELAILVMPLRGPAVGGFSTFWRTRAFDALIAGTRGPGPTLRVGTPRGGEVAASEGAGGGSDSLPDLAALVQQRLADEMVALPLAPLPWVWAERGGPLPVGFHPHYGPQCLQEDARLGFAGH